MKKVLYAAALLFLVTACTLKPESKPYTWEDDLHQRLLTDFSRTEDEVKEYIRKYIPDVADEQMCQWEASKALECMTLDGEKRYFRNAAPNLFRVDSVCYQIKAAKDGVSFSGSEKVNMENLPEIIASVKKSGNPITAPKRMRITYTLTVDSNAVPAGELVRCWLPYPRTDQSRQQDVKFISASESKYTLSPQDCLHSTLYMEKRAVQDQPTVFSESFEYTANAEWHNLKPKDIQPYDTTSSIYKEYTAEREKHVIFSPRMRELAAKLTAGETNPLLKAKRIFRWVNDNFPWASAREYSTIENNCISQYAIDYYLSHTMSSKKENVVCQHIDMSSLQLTLEVLSSIYNMKIYSFSSSVLFTTKLINHKTETFAVTHPKVDTIKSDNMIYDYVNGFVSVN